MPQSKLPSTSPSKRMTPAKRMSTPSPPIDLLAADAQRLAAQQPQGADAVAADVHQRPALQPALQAHVVGVEAAEAERRAHERTSPIAPERTSRTSSSVCG